VQPARGNRAAIDPVLLAAAVPARAGERVLELGCGTGAAALCLAARAPNCRVFGIDLQDGLIGLAREGAAASGLAERVTFEAGDLLTFKGGPFDHVMANPPYRAAGSGRISPDPGRAAANVEGSADLAAWVRVAVAHVKPAGSVTFIHARERGGEVASLFAAAGRTVTLFPLLPRRDAPARRVLIQAKSGAGAIRTAAGLVLHAADGSFTPEADAVLRHGHALAI
jgi:tRNA1(Val) A37 N6-methylase TrmN6